MKVLRRQVSFAKREPISFLWLSGCSLSGRSQQANRSASPAKRYLRWVLHGVPHRGKVYILMPYIAYIALLLYLTFHQTLPELPPFSCADVQGLDTGKGELRNHLSRALHYPAEVASGEWQAICRQVILMASLFIPIMMTWFLNHVRFSLWGRFLWLGQFLAFSSFFSLFS